MGSAHNRCGNALLIALCGWMAASVMSRPAFACGTAPLGEGRVVAIADSRTLALDDGRLVRLAGIEWAVSNEAAKAALAELLLNQPVALKGTAAPDRYGRFHAFPFVSGSETPIQYVLLERGLALTDGREANTACAQALLRREQEARAGQRGLWASGHGGRHSADAPNAVLRDQGRFAIVEGRVVSVRESGSIIYVNFGRRWSEDFTVTIAKRNESAFTAGGLAPRSLSGRTVRVRGFVEERAGPWIEAVRPEQFEVLPAGQKGM